MSGIDYFYLETNLRSNPSNLRYPKWKLISLLLDIRVVSDVLYMQFKHISNIRFQITLYVETNS